MSRYRISLVVIVNDLVHVRGILARAWDVTLIRRPPPLSTPTTAPPLGETLGI